MKIQNIDARGVWEVENFLSSDELTTLLKFAKNSEENLWYSEELPNHWNGKILQLAKIMNNNQKYENFLDNLNIKIFNLFENLFSALPVSDLIRYRVGDGKGVHRDNVEAHDLDNVFGLVVYLNADYLGGELYYPEIRLKIKPKENSVLIHYAGLSHGVEEVVSGTRYVLTSFIKGNQNTKVRGI